MAISIERRSEASIAFQQMQEERKTSNPIVRGVRAVADNIASRRFRKDFYQNTEQQAAEHAGTKGLSGSDLFDPRHEEFKRKTDEEIKVKISGITGLDMSQLTVDDAERIYNAYQTEQTITRDKLRSTQVIYFDKAAMTDTQPAPSIHDIFNAAFDELETNEAIPVYNEELDLRDTDEAGIPVYQEQPDARETGEFPAVVDVDTDIMGRLNTYAAGGD